MRTALSITLAGACHCCNVFTLKTLSTTPGLTMNNEIRIVLRLSQPAFTGAVLLANSAQAIKRARQAEIHRQRNASQRSNMRTSIKKVIASIAAGDRDAAMQAYEKAVPVIDHAAGKGLIHANKAARHKSRLNQHIRDM
jgi:small subunit ribosomal protein S20